MNVIIDKANKEAQRVSPNRDLVLLQKDDKFDEDYEKSEYSLDEENDNQSIQKNRGNKR